MSAYHNDRVFGQIKTVTPCGEIFLNFISGRKNVSKSGYKTEPWNCRVRHLQCTLTLPQVQSGSPLIPGIYNFIKSNRGWHNFAAYKVYITTLYQCCHGYNITVDISE